MSEIEAVASFASNTQVAVAVEETESIQFALPLSALPYSNNSQRKVFEFSWGDASPLLIAEIRGVINRCEIAIIEGFDVPSSLSVGSGVDYNEVFPVFPGFTLQESGTYQQHSLVEFNSIQQIFLRIFPGVGCSSGRGVITIDWSDL